ncbi:hypothetical protein [Mariniphaga sediminis]|jgi:hypothetical protein|uniref:hypothetical protein n=1 Tax=Mariniphaga sediminis TaxID=1628158 RepID=UPI003568551A
MMEKQNIPDAVPFKFGKKLKTWLGIAASVGLIALLWGVFIAQLPASRIWANLWLNALMFLFLGLGALFFWTVNTLGESTWQINIQRIMESMGLTIPFAILFFVIAFPGLKHLFEWTHTEHLDEILQKKTAYLNMPFWLIRFVSYFALWTFFAFYLRKISVKNDFEPRDNFLKKLRSTSGWFIVIFAITSSTSAWDWLMSIDGHWFSTLYGWYIFSGMFVASISVIILISVAFKRFNIMPNINSEHLHDLGKYLFGFSIFWAYLWISQYLLIWYGNIPEETIYYVERVDNFNTLFYVNMTVNFLFPFLALMTRGAKRQPLYLSVIAIVVLIGHYIDLYLAIMPGAVGHEQAAIGLLEIGLPFFYLAAFLLLFLVFFEKAKPVPENHPYFIESSDYENI